MDTSGFGTVPAYLSVDVAKRPEESRDISLRCEVCEIFESQARVKTVALINKLA